MPLTYEYSTSKTIREVGMLGHAPSRTHHLTVFSSRYLRPNLKNCLVAIHMLNGCLERLAPVESYLKPCILLLLRFNSLSHIAVLS